MNVINTPIKNLVIIEPVVYNDSRGYFFESYNEKKFIDKDLNLNFLQDNESKSVYGVIRGLHYQEKPHAQTKLIRAVQGKILDVVVDLRKDSETFGQHYSIELSSENKKQLIVPKGFAHGFSVLSDTVIVAYKCDNLYHKESEKGIKFDDSELNIDWKIKKEDAIVSDKDKLLPSFNIENNYF